MKKQKEKYSVKNYSKTAVIAMYKLSRLLLLKTFLMTNALVSNARNLNEGLPITFSKYGNMMPAE